MREAYASAALAASDDGLPSSGNPTGSGQGTPQGRRPWQASLLLLCAIIATGMVFAYVAWGDSSGLRDVMTGLATRYAPIHRAQASVASTARAAPVEAPAAVATDAAQATEPAAAPSPDELAALRRANAALNARLARLEAALAVQEGVVDRREAPAPPPAGE